MKKITYQITLNDDDYLECMEKLAKLILFPANGNMIFKVEEKEEHCGEENQRPVIVNGVKYSSYADYIASRRERSEK